MSDNLGPNQTRVLDSEYRNFESITYQKRKPPLSSEMDLGGKIDAERSQKLTRFNLPSGFGSVGKILDAPTTTTLAAFEATCQCGDVVCSPSLVANTIRLIGKDKGLVTERNEAIVNGNRILVQGTNTSDENNTIVLNPPPSIGNRVDFVFLEVWRKLIYPTDTVFKYGNVFAGSAIANDLLDPAMGIETSLRIQLQYQIRVVGSLADSGIDIVNNPEGFDPLAVFVRGPLPAPITTCLNAEFTRFPGDMGLWIAGAGVDTEDVINTVDGYTYAIPMFAIRRRNTSDYHFDTMPNGAKKTLADYTAGIASDRPDNLYCDWIAAEDIIDLRHRVMAGENLREVCDSAFRTLIGNKNRGKMVSSSLSGNVLGTTIVQVDAVSDEVKGGSERIGTGDGSRRIFSNAAMDQVGTFITKSPVGTWTNGTSVTITTSNYPTGTTISALGDIFNKTDGYIKTEFIWTGIGTDTLIVTLNSGGTILGTTRAIIIECTMSIPLSSEGLSNVPLQFLQSMREDSTCAQAMEDLDIRVRTSAPVIANDGTHFNMLRNHGGRITDMWDFGHQMVYYALGNGTTTFTIPLVHEGYTILGIGEIKYAGNVVSSPTIVRSISNFTVTGVTTFTSGDAIECVLYTSAKFFIGNKQGRAITDCLEMALLVSDEATFVSTFHIDGGTREILGLCSYSASDGAGFAYAADGSQYALLNNNRFYPLDSTRTYSVITLSTPVPGPITVPVMLRSAIDSTEGYNFFYKTVPYQGLTDSSVTGRIETIGSSIVTSAGSGSITNLTYSVGQANFNLDSTVVDGTNTEWLSYVRAGNVIRANAESTKEYLIKTVVSDTRVFLDSKSTRYGSYENYTIEAKDQPSFSNANIIDIMPTRDTNNDSTAANHPLTFFWQPEEYDLLGDRVLETRVICRVQDIADMPANSMWIGENVNPIGRGRSRVHLPEDIAKMGRSNLGLKYESMSDVTSSYYKKTFQSYILNKDNSGQLYLMVVGSETDNTSAFNFLNHASNYDSVDLFEIPGRPILAKRVL
jgi:hypothetical protein